MFSIACSQPFQNLLGTAISLQIAESVVHRNTPPPGGGYQEARSRQLADSLAKCQLATHSAAPRQAAPWPRSSLDRASLSGSRQSTLRQRSARRLPEAQTAGSRSSTRAHRDG